MPFSLPPNGGTNAGPSLGTPSFSSGAALPSLDGGNPSFYSAGGAQNPNDPNQYSDVGKSYINLLDFNSQSEAHVDAGNKQGGFFQGILGAVGGTFGQGGRDVGQTLGKIIETPFGILGGIAGHLGDIPLPVPGAGGGKPESGPPSLWTDVTAPLTQGQKDIFGHQGSLTLGSIFQSTLGLFSMTSRAVERAVAEGTNRPIPPDLQAQIDAGKMTHAQALDNMVLTNRGYSDNPIENMLLSIVLDPLTFATLGVGAVGKAATAGVKIERGLEVAGKVAGVADTATTFASTAGHITPAAARAALANADAPLVALSRLERLGLATAGRLPGFNEAVVPIANQITRLTDPLRIFGGGNIGKRGTEQLAVAAGAGVVHAYKDFVYVGVRNLASKVVPDGAARFDRVMGIFGTNILHQYVMDLQTKDALRIGEVPITELAGKALTPEGSIKGLIANKAFDVNVSTQIEQLIEKVKPFFAGMTKDDLRAATIRKLAYVIKSDPLALKGMKVGYDEAALVHAAFYADLGSQVVDEIIPALRQMKTLPAGLTAAEAERLTIIGEKTLTAERLPALEAALKAGDAGGVRDFIGKYDDFNWITAGKQAVGTDAEVLDRVARWLDANRGSMLHEVPLTDAAGAIRNDLPQQLQRWANDVGPDGYRLGLGPPGDINPELLYRITRGADGRVLDVHPWVPFTSEASTITGTGRWRALQGTMFHQIRVEKILWTNRRRFVQEFAKAESGIPPAIADRIYQRIMFQASTVHGLTPRGLKPEELYDVAAKVLKEEHIAADVSERQVVDGLLVAFKGDFSQVGVTQALTGTMKARLPGAGMNYWGRLAENFYPLAKFALAPVFMTQEFIEPYILALMRGLVVPLRRSSPGFTEALAKRNATYQLLRSSLDPEGAVLEQAEFQKVFVAMRQDAKKRFGGNTIFGRMSGDIWGNIAQRKEVAEVMQVQAELGRSLKEAFTEIKGPTYWAELERNYKTVDAGDIAFHWLADNFKVVDQNGQVVTAFADLVNPINIGKTTRVSADLGAKGVTFDHLAKFMGRTDATPGATLLSELRTGVLSRDEFIAKAVDAGVPEEVATRSYNVGSTTWTEEEFWKGFAKTFLKGVPAKEKKLAISAQRALVNVRALTMGERPEDWLKARIAAVPGTLPAGYKAEDLLKQASTLTEMRDGLIRDSLVNHGGSLDAAIAKADTYVASAPPPAFKARIGMSFLTPSDTNGLVRNLMPNTLPTEHAAAAMFDRLAVTDPEALRASFRTVAKGEPVAGYKIAYEADPFVGDYARTGLRFSDVRAAGHTIRSVQIMDSKGEVVGFVAGDLNTETNTIKVIQSQVLDPHGRKGLANWAYRQLEQRTGATIVQATDQSESARALWAQADRPFGPPTRTMREFRTANDAGTLVPVGAVEARPPSALTQTSRLSVDGPYMGPGDVAGGVKTPIKITPDGRVIDGNDRLQAARQAGLADIPVQVMDFPRPASLVSTNDARLIEGAIANAQELHQRQLLEFATADGKPERYGPVTADHIMEHNLAWMDSASGKDAANWYTGMLDRVERAFGADKGPVMLAFAMSQANTSPVMGLRDVMHVIEQVFAGGFEAITMGKGGTRETTGLGAKARSVAATATSPAKVVTGRVNEVNILRALLSGTAPGMTIERGFGAKLNDFLDSLLGNTTRRWMGRDATGLQPVAVDRWTARDVGLLDTKTVQHLADKYGKTLDNGVVEITDKNGTVLRVRGVPSAKDPTTMSNWHLVDAQGNFVDRAGNAIPGKRAIPKAGERGGPVAGYKLNWMAPSADHPGWHRVDVLDATGAKVGYATFIDGGLSTAGAQGFHAGLVNIEPVAQRKGLANWMYAEAEARVGKPLEADIAARQTAEGKALWSQANRPFGDPNAFTVTPVSALDLLGAPEGYAYEHGVQVMNDVAAKMNSYVNPDGTIGLYGKSDWQARDAQALGWMRMQKVMPGASESPFDAFAKNQYSVLNEVSTENADLVKYDQQVQRLDPLARQSFARDVSTWFGQQLRDRFGITTTDTNWIAPSGWGTWRGFGSPISILSTPETARDVADMAALTFRQKAVLAPQFVSDSFFRASAHQPVVDLSLPMTSGLDEAGATQRLLDLAAAIDPASGFTIIRDQVEGKLILRMIDSTLAEGETPFFARQASGMLDLPALDQQLADAAGKLGLKPEDVLSDSWNAEVYVAGPKMIEGRLRAPLERQIQQAYDAGDLALGRRLQAEVEAIDPKATGLIPDWENFLADTASRLRERGRAVPEATLGSLRDDASQRMGQALAEHDPGNTARRLSGDVLQEQRTGHVLGFTATLADNRVILHGLKNADAVTGLHEMAHVFAKDLDQSMRETIMQAYRDTATATRGDLQAQIRVAEAKAAQSVSLRTKTRYQNIANALKQGLGNIGDGTEAWGTAHEEFFVSEFQRWIKGGQAPVRELQGAFDHFRNWIESIWNNIKGTNPSDAVSPQMKTLLDDMFRGPHRPSTHYQLDQQVLRMAALQRLGIAQDQAFTTQYFKKGRSFAERSINHPFFGLYPFSYMVGKILPEMLRFVALRPFGLMAPMVGWNALRSVSDSVRVQQRTDPGFRQFMNDNKDLFYALNTLFPAFPNDVPFNAPLYLRRIAQQGLVNADRAQKGLRTKPVDYMAGVPDTLKYINGPLNAIDLAGGLIGGTGDLVRRALGQPTPQEEFLGPQKVAAQKAKAARVIQQATIDIQRQ